MADMVSVSDFVLLVAAGLGGSALVAILLHWMEGRGWFSERTYDRQSGGPQH